MNFGGLFISLLALCFLLYNYFPNTFFGEWLLSMKVNLVPYHSYAKLWPLPLFLIGIWGAFYKQNSDRHLSRYPEEHHPYLSFMNWATISVSYAALVWFCFIEYEGFVRIVNEPLLALAVLFLCMGMYTLYGTDRFHHWDNGLGPIAKIIGYLSVIAGFLLSFWLVLLLLGVISGVKEENRR